MDFATILNNMSNAFFHILSAPFKNLEIWWYLFPILALWFTLEFYFGIYESESMGWNTALANAFSFAWVNIEGMRVLFEKSLELFWLRFSVLFLFITYSIIVIYLVFTHKIKDKYAFLAASHHLTYYFSAISILWMHGLLDLSLWVIIDLIIILFITVLFFTLIKKLLPNKTNSRSDEHQYEKMGFDKNPSSNNSTVQPSSSAATTSTTSNPEEASSPLDFLNFK
jgi:hypothetical protein